MSLQYIIDGYNIINHPLFSQRAGRKTADSRDALVELFRTGALIKSPKNKITLVFDGYPKGSHSQNYSAGNITVIFSRLISADERIKKMVEDSALRSQIIVVSDDKEIRLAVNSLGARSLGVEELIGSKERQRPQAGRELIKPELKFSQIDKINRELSKIWLK